ncbi:MAG TPA: FliM/FliN family flagellar motor switch protein, partial [Nitrospiria bacterium]|nr:FliM/FliN family flagellar motor switch protein [Nitrospiria bacterium]
MTEDMLTHDLPETQQPEEDDAELFSVVSRGGQRSEDAYDDNNPIFHKIEFVHDVPLKLSVEIGQTSLSVREILALNVGNVVEFTKVVGEPMDITVS